MTNTLPYILSCTQAVTVTRLKQLLRAISSGHNREQRDGLRWGVSYFNTTEINRELISQVTIKTI